MMDFSHDYVDYAMSDEEDYVELDAETITQGIQSVAHERPEVRSEALRTQTASRRSPGRSTKAQVHSRKLNTNVVAVDLGTLTDEAHHVATGDPYYCLNPNCRTILSAKDELLPADPNDAEFVVDDGLHLWVCRFCGHRNIVAVEAAEKPVGDSQDYILERPEMTDAKLDEPLVVFCVDVSGSMGSRCKLPDGEKAPAKNLPTRLQAVQSTISDQLQTLARDSPNARVAMIGFSSEVTIHGDGSTGRQQVIAGDPLNSRQLCTQFGVDYMVNMSIADSREQLAGALWSLHHHGQTALGPALVVSVALAAQRRGSSVIICTDGCANVGMGSLRNDGSDAAEEEASQEWYQEIGEWALRAGIVVNVISIADDGCRLELLGNVCDLSEGVVTLLNPLELSQDFSEVVQRSPIATHVQARMFIHPGLRFLTDEESLEQNSQLPGGAPEPEEKDLEDVQKHTLNQTQDVGNAFETHKIYFEYAVKREKLDLYKDLPGGLPFQVQLNYTRLDGAKMLRVVTHIKPITTNREDVVRTVNSGLVSRHSSYKTQRLAKKGNYEAARANTYLTSAWMSTNSRTRSQRMEANRYVVENEEFDGMMQTEQVSELQRGVRAVDMSANERRSARSSRRNDRMAVKMRKK